MNRGTILNHVFDFLGNNAGTPAKVEVKNKPIINQTLENKQGQLTTQVINNNEPEFSKDDLKITNQSGWQKLSSLDVMGRPQVGNALLNYRLMPTKERERLTIKTPGYRAIRDAQGNFLYHRSHIIGYQLTGENNNVKNLFTGTRQLNAMYNGNPNISMEHYENQVANYLRQNRNGYVRYQVKPVYKTIERVPRGVEMQAQSVGNNAVKFHVFIPNTQEGYQINYMTGQATLERE